MAEQRNHFNVTLPNVANTLGVVIFLLFMMAETQIIKQADYLRRDLFSHIYFVMK